MVSRMDVRQRLRRLAVAFVPNEGERQDFVRTYMERAVELIGEVAELGYDYELVLVPGGQTLQGLLDLLRKTSKANGRKGKLHLCQSSWRKNQDEMRDKGNFGIAEKAELSVLLLNPDDEDGKREGLFFTDLDIFKQDRRAEAMMRKKPGMRYLTVAEYVCSNIARMANKEQILDEETFTRFLQYSLYHMVDGCLVYLILRASFLCAQMFYFDDDPLKDARWDTGVRFSVRKFYQT